MTSLLTILHVLTCLFLMLTVLLQEGKGGGMGGAFGGGNSATVFGGSGASSFLQKITAGAGCVFMATSMILAFLASHNSSDALEKFGEQQSELARQKEAAKDNALKSQGSNGSAAQVEQGSASVMMSTPAETPAPAGSAASPLNSTTGSATSPLNSTTGSATGAAGTPASTTQPTNNSPTVPGTATVPKPGTNGTTTTKSNLGTATTVPTSTGPSTSGSAPASAGPSGSSKDHAINPAKGSAANPGNTKTGPSAGVTSPSSAPASAPATPSQAGLPEGKVGSAAPANSSPNAPK